MGLSWVAFGHPEPKAYLDLHAAASALVHGRLLVPQALVSSVPLPAIYSDEQVCRMEVEPTRTLGAPTGESVTQFWAHCPRGGRLGVVFTPLGADVVVTLSSGAQVHSARLTARTTSVSWPALALGQSSSPVTAPPVPVVSAPPVSAPPRRTDGRPLIYLGLVVVGVGLLLFALLRRR